MQQTPERRLSQDPERVQVDRGRGAAVAALAMETVTVLDLFRSRERSATRIIQRPRTERHCRAAFPSAILSALTDASPTAGSRIQAVAAFWTKPRAALLPNGFDSVRRAMELVIRYHRILKKITTGSSSATRRPPRRTTDTQMSPRWYLSSRYLPCVARRSRSPRASCSLMRDSSVSTTASPSSNCFSGTIPSVSTRRSAVGTRV